MDLKQAFGNTYKTQESYPPPLINSPILGSPTPDVQSSGGGYPPDVYLVQVTIGRDDAHLLCMFLLVFTISVLMNRK